MIPQLRKRTWIALSAVLVLSLVALWFRSSPTTGVYVTFMQTTNEPTNGRVGIIEMVNMEDEDVFVMGGWYVPAKRDDLSASWDTPIASIYRDEPVLSARSTNIVRVSMPTNGGVYRLVFQCVPAHTIPWPNQGSLRYRVMERVSPWLNPSQRTLVRWYGGWFAPSQPIDFSQ